MNLAAWRGAYKGILSDKMLSDQSTYGFEDTWRKSLRNPEHINFVCKKFGQITGFVSIGPSRDTDHDPKRVAEMYGMYLLPEYWGQGQGWAMWRSARERLSTSTFSTIVLWVPEKNARAIKFFERIGFVRDASARRDTTREGIACPENRYSMALG